MDCFVGPYPDAPTAYVVNHYRRDGTFEEHKVLMGYQNQDAAVNDYCAAYDLPRTRAFEFSLPKLREWLGTGDVARPLMRAV